MNYPQRQNKQSLGIENLKGVTVANSKSGTGFKVSFRAEVVSNGERLLQTGFATAAAAAKVANSFYKQIFGSYREAKKAGYWNAVK